MPSSSTRPPRIRPSAIQSRWARGAPTWPTMSRWSGGTRRWRNRLRPHGAATGQYCSASPGWYCWPAPNAAAPPAGGAGAEGGSGGLEQLAGKGRGDQGAGFGHPVKGDEGAKARPLLAAEQHLIERAEPVAQRLETMRLADLEDEVLQRLGVRRSLERGEAGGQVLERRALLVGRGAEHLGGLHPVVEIAHGIASQPVEIGMRGGGGAGHVARDEPPQHAHVLGIGGRNEIEQQAEGHRHIDRRGM